MNSLLLHVDGASTNSGIPELRKIEASKESSSSFSERLQDAVTAGSQVVRRNEDVQARLAAKPVVSYGNKTVSGVGKPVSGANKPVSGVSKPVSGISKTGPGNAHERSAGHADSQRAPVSGKEGRRKQTETAGSSTPDPTSEKDLDNAGPGESRPAASVSPRQDRASDGGESSFGQLVGGWAGKMSCSKVGREAPDGPSQPVLSLGAATEAAGIQVATAVSTSCDFTSAVTQPMVPAETNSPPVSIEPASCLADSGSTGETASAQTCSTDAGASSTSAGDAVSAGNNNCAIAMKGDLSDFTLSQSNSSDSTLGLESLLVESAVSTDTKEAGQDNPAASDERVAIKAQAPATAAAAASRGSALSMAAALNGSVNVIPMVTMVAGNFKKSVEPAASGAASTEPSPSTHSSALPAPSSSATSVESAPPDEASTGSAPRPAWNAQTSVSFTGPLTANAMTSTAQNGAAGPVDHSLPAGSSLSGGPGPNGAPGLSVISFGSPASTPAVGVQPGSAPEVVSDSPAKSSAQPEGTPQTAQDERVNGATLSSLPSGTEMRVQMHTDAFGPLEIRATLEAGKIGAAIGVDSAEAHHTLLSQVSALQQSLADRHVQLDQVTVVRTSGQNFTDLGWSPNQQHDGSAPYSRLAQQARGQDSESQAAVVPEIEAGQAETQWGRLSVRA